MLTEDLNLVAATSSKLEKEALLVKAFQDEQTKRLVRLALDPFSMFHMTLDEEEEARARKNFPKGGGALGLLADPVYWDKVEKLCMKLTARLVTGNAAKEEVGWVLDTAHSAEHIRWTCRIINKDLRAGFSISTTNKACPGLIEPFQVALATPYEEGKHKLKGNWSWDTKIDGLRLVIVDGKAYTRNGKEVTSVAHVIEQLGTAIDLTAWVLDGEILSGAEFNEGSGNIRRSENDATAVYNCFDLVDREEWRTKKTRPYGQRRKDLEKLLGRAKLPAVKLVKNTKLPKDVSPEYLKRLCEERVAAGDEGVMFKDDDSPYIFKRSKNLLKLKLFDNSDGYVVGFEEGEGKNKGTLGAVLCDFDGVVTAVGSGWSDEDRKEIYGNMPNYRGRCLEVQNQGRSPEGKLRFPTVVKWRPDKDKIDV